MAIKKLAHYSVRASELEKSKRFYIDVLGFKDGFRPPFNFPGAWLYHGDDESDYGIVHLLGPGPDGAGLSEYLGDRALGQGTGTLDHIAFLATNLPDMHARLNSAGISFRERTVPSLGLHQVFFEDPSGVTIELNYPAEEAVAARPERA
jgi:catechol 2,3-dioxygenase-like lactoylglutathione lyase family enzyme